MEAIRFNITGAARKEFAKTVGELIGEAAVYLNLSYISPPTHSRA
jgi:hypothetical protein